MNTSLLATVNLNNWFGGYKGAPRSFEVIPVYGFGWGHTFGSTTDQGLRLNATYAKKNMLRQVLTSRLTLAKAKLGKYM